MSAAQRRAALERVKAQREARAERQARMTEDEARARRRAQQANLNHLVAGTPDSLAEVNAAAADLESVLAAMRGFEKEGADLEQAARALDELVRRDARVTRTDEDAAIRSELRARLPQVRERLHELVLELFVLAAAEGRGGYPADHYVCEQIDGARVNTDASKRRAEILDQLTNRQETTDGQ
jgi:hypothetical protein